MGVFSDLIIAVRLRLSHLSGDFYFKGVSTNDNKTFECNRGERNSRTETGASC